MNVEIDGKEYRMAYGWGAAYLFEEVEPKPFDPKKVRHVHLMMFCALMNANEGFPYTWDQFVKLLDTDRTLFPRLSTAFAAAFAQWSGTEQPETAEESKKKAASTPEDSTGSSSESAG